MHSNICLLMIIDSLFLNAVMLRWHGKVEVNLMGTNESVSSSCCFRWRHGWLIPIWTCSTKQTPRRVSPGLHLLRYCRFDLHHHSFPYEGECFFVFFSFTIMVTLIKQDRIISHSYKVNAMQKKGSDWAHMLVHYTSYRLQLLEKSVILFHPPLTKISTGCAFLFFFFFFLWFLPKAICKHWRQHIFLFLLADASCFVL